MAIYIYADLLLARNNALISTGLPAALTLPGWRRPLCPLTLCSMCTSFCKFSWERKTAFRRLHGDCFYTSRQNFPHPSSPFYFFRTDITQLGFRENWTKDLYPVSLLPALRILQNLITCIHACCDLLEFFHL